MSHDRPVTVDIVTALRAREWWPPVGDESRVAEKAAEVIERHRVAETELRADFERVSDELATANALLAEAREALAFYADTSKYPAPLTGGMGALWSDSGQVARSAIAKLDPAPALVEAAA